MGVDLTLFMADWERLVAFPVQRRIDALDDTVWPSGGDQSLRWGRGGGWRWPPDQGARWCAAYEFFTTTGSYRPHYRAGDGWADMRPLVDAPVREAMDAFLGGLIWDADPIEDPALTGGEGLFPPVADPRRPHLLLVCSPEAVERKVPAWKGVEPYLDVMRAPFAAECEGWAGRPGTFEGFVALLREWGDVVTEAAGRGWGLVGVP
ncbi:hypothetical protein [Streptomyces sp. A1136]|uniref:hypothetical protein n=1 Tax=Streptomyces sp. A1136 TaxID=2563102 RepID=UPI00109E6E06|nr:hypothetical protein [Streptomyces sp. A1136]THA50124.1 hypothetical protein E6R62_25755 [Streptomyces sp. A1136]